MNKQGYLAVAVIGLLLFTIAGVGQVPVYEDFESTLYPDIPTGWVINPVPGDPEQDVCWKVVDKALLGGEPDWVLDFPSGTRALYFGKVDPSTGEGSYEDGSNRVQSQVWSDYNVAQITTTGWLRISFWFLRLVEYYTAGDYDEITVTYEFFDNTGNPIPGGAGQLLHKSSKDPCPNKWEYFESEPKQVPVNADTIQIKFDFDSVDGNFNDYLGWLIDDLRIEEAYAPLELGLYDAGNNPVNFIEGEVGTPLPGYYLKAKGGKAVDGDHYTWTLVEGYELPDRLSFGQQQDLDGDNVLELPITGTPEVPGAYYVEVEVEDDAGNATTLGFWININPTGDYSVYEEDFNTTPPALPTGWTKTPGSLWHTTANVAGVAAPLAFPCAYFGKDDATNPTYDTGRRVWGYLTSPAWDVSSYRGSKMVVEFEYWRDVEGTDDGAYDKTFVEISFDGGQTWVPIWQKDSVDPSQNTWNLEVIENDVNGDPLVVPEDADSVLIRFGFDSVDSLNNDHVGWLIDDVKVRFVPNQMEIITERLPQAEAGAPYYAKIEVTGGTPPYQWETDTRLPPQLVLNRHTGEITGIPQDPGSYDFTVTVRDNKDKIVEKSFTIEVTRMVTLFADDFEAGLNKWTTTGLWHQSDLIKGVDLTAHGSVAYYGKDDATNPNYRTGARTSGYLTSQEFNLNDADYFKISFSYWRQVEYFSGGGYDHTSVQVRFYKDGNWGDWLTIWHSDSDNPSKKEWRTVEAAYQVEPGATKMQVRFWFDSVDKYYNSYIGWLVDEVRVTKTDSGDPISTLSLPFASPRETQLTFLNYPNPIRDVHTTVFAVRGVEAEVIRVEIYDLSGRLVYSAEAPGSELVWHTEDLAGRFLANGVYLYRVLAKVNGSWVASELKKLAILR